MVVATWAAVAILFGLLVAWIAQRKGREIIPWGLYGAVAGLFALPHALLLEPRLDDRRWSPIRFGLPARPQSCPYCLARVHEDAVVCRHCGTPLYNRSGNDEADAAMEGRAPERVREPAPASAPAAASPPVSARTTQPGGAGPVEHEIGARQASRAFVPEFPVKPERRSSPMIHLVLALVACVGTAVGTIWLSGNPPPGLDDLLPPEGRAWTAGPKDRPVAGDVRSLLRGDQRDSGSNAAANGTLVLQVPQQPLPALPADGEYVPPRGVVPPSTEPKPMPQGESKIAAPKQDLVEDVRSILGRLRSGTGKAEGGHGTQVVASGDLVKELQLRLRGEGFDPGPIDGRAGRRTQKAVRAFQQQEGLPTTGRISEAVLTRLGMLDPAPTKMILEVTRPVGTAVMEAETAGEGVANTE